MIAGKFHFKNTLLIRPDILGGLAELIKTYKKEIKFTIRSIDDTTINFAVLDALVSFGRKFDNKIKELKLVSNDNDFEIIFKPGNNDNFSIWASIICSYRLESKEEEVLFLEKIKDILENAVAPYSFASKFSLAAVGVLIPLLFYSYFASDYTNNLILLLGIAALGLTAGLWSYLFPQLVFLWGNEKDTYFKKVVLRKNALWGCAAVTLFGIGILALTI